MIKKDKALPPRVFEHGRWYYLVTRADGKQNWRKLTLIKDGLHALYTALAELHASDIAPDRIPALVVDWTKEVGAGRSDKTKANDRWVLGAISTRLGEFRASQLTPPDCVEFLKPYRTKPRTFNEMRAGLRELMRFAEEKGYRPAGSNPVTAIKTMRRKKRDRYPTDSEVRRIKVAACYGADGKRTRMGPTLASLIDLAYLTGQRVSDILDLRWNKQAALDDKGEVDAAYISNEGLHFKPSKTAKTTGAKVLIEWSPRLRQVIERIKGMGRRNMVFVITNQEAQRYDYEAFKSVWRRAILRSGVQDLHFHDLRAKALTDKEEQHGMQHARRMGAHSTENQTAAYVRHRKAQKTTPTR